MAGSDRTSRHLETETGIPWSTLKRNLKELKEEEDGFVLPTGERVRVTFEDGSYSVQRPGVIPDALRRVMESVKRATDAVEASLASAMEAAWGWRTIRGPLSPTDEDPAGPSTPP